MEFLSNDLQWIQSNSAWLVQIDTLLLIIFVFGAWLRIWNRMWPHLFINTKRHVTWLYMDPPIFVWSLGYLEPRGKSLQYLAYEVSQRDFWLRRIWHFWFLIVISRDLWGVIYPIVWSKWENILHYTKYLYKNIEAQNGVERKKNIIRTIPAS